VDDEQEPRLGAEVARAFARLEVKLAEVEAKIDCSSARLTITALCGKCNACMDAELKGARLRLAAAEKRAAFFDARNLEQSRVIEALEEKLAAAEKRADNAEASLRICKQSDVDFNAACRREADDLRVKLAETEARLVATLTGDLKASEEAMRAINAERDAERALCDELAVALRRAFDDEHWDHVAEEAIAKYDAAREARARVCGRHCAKLSCDDSCILPENHDGYCQCRMPTGLTRAP
jgi:hypothetical protein